MNNSITPRRLLTSTNFILVSLLTVNLGADAAAQQSCVNTNASTLACENRAAQNVHSTLNITDTLSPGGTTLRNGSLYKTHQFEGRANQQIEVLVESSEFNTFLTVFGPGRQVIGQKDITNVSRNSTLSLTLPHDGLYLVVVNGYGREDSGRYRLSIQTVGNSSTPQREVDNSVSSSQTSDSFLAETRSGFRLYRHRNNYSIEYPENWVVDSAPRTDLLTIWSQRPSRQGGGGIFGDMVKTEIFIDQRPFNANRIVGEIGRRPDAQITRRGDITIGGRRALRIWSEDQHGQTISSYIEYSNNQTVEIHSYYSYNNNSWIETIQDMHWSFRKLN